MLCMSWNERKNKKIVRSVRNRGDMKQNMSECEEKNAEWGLERKILAKMWKRVVRQGRGVLPT